MSLVVTFDERAMRGVKAGGMIEETAGTRVEFDGEGRLKYRNVSGTVRRLDPVYVMSIEGDDSNNVVGLGL